MYHYRKDGRYMTDNRIKSGAVRDGKPHKYFTMSFDDGVTQDRAVLEICRKYNFYGATFFINTGLFGANWADVGPSQFGRDDVTHIRFTEEEIKTGIYDGFDVQVHTLHHPCLVWYDGQPEKLKEELNLDYVAFSIPDDFIVGYGLDYDQQGRCLRDVYTIVE